MRPEYQRKLDRIVRVALRTMLDEQIRTIQREIAERARILPLLDARMKIRMARGGAPYVEDGR